MVFADRKPQKCPHCGKDIAKAVLVIHSRISTTKILILVGLPTPFPEQEKFGCNTCDSRFFKDTKVARAYLNGESDWY